MMASVEICSSSKSWMSTVLSSSGLLEVVARQPAALDDVRWRGADFPTVLTLAPIRHNNLKAWQGSRVRNHFLY
jgi:hypothetical protein